MSENSFGHWCELCQCYHSSASCFNPARRFINELEVERNTLKAEIEKLKEALARIYSRQSLYANFAVAIVCDIEIDGSGKLLEEIRELSMRFRRLESEK